jgi:hypothetical protein
MYINSKQLALRWAFHPAPLPATSPVTRPSSLRSSGWDVRSVFPWLRWKPGKSSNSQIHKLRANLTFKGKNNENLKNTQL